METKIIYIEGVELVARKGYFPKYDKLDDFPDSCGPGRGFFEKLVPDKIMKLRISAACDIHDDCFNNGGPTWAEFHQCNSMFIRNILSIIMSKSMTGINYLRIAIAAFYFRSVDSAGALIYKSIQRSKGLEMS